MSMICLMLVATVSGQITYTTVKEGRCDDPSNSGGSTVIQTRYSPIDRAMCEAAAVAMNDDDKTCNDQSEKDRPPKCYKIKDNWKLMFNVKSSGTSDCSKDYQCLCATGCAIGWTTPTPDGCSQCISCSSTQYESIPCLAWKPRVCTSCADTMNSVASILDGSCTACTGNKDGLFYSYTSLYPLTGTGSTSATCSAATCAAGFHTFTNNGCSECTSACSETEYESTACTPTTNRVCTSCAATTNSVASILDGSCTACIGSTSDLCTAATCAPGFHTFKYKCEFDVCGAECSECDICSETEYESTACTPTTNRV